MIHTLYINVGFDHVWVSCVLRTYFNSQPFRRTNGTAAITSQGTANEAKWCHRRFVTKTNGQEDTALWWLLDTWLLRKIPFCERRLYDLENGQEQVPMRGSHCSTYTVPHGNDAKTC